MREQLEELYLKFYTKESLDKLYFLTEYKLVNFSFVRLNPNEQSFVKSLYEKLRIDFEFFNDNKEIIDMIEDDENFSKLFFSLVAMINLQNNDSVILADKQLDLAISIENYEQNLRSHIFLSRGINYNRTDIYSQLYFFAPSGQIDSKESKSYNNFIENIQKQMLGKNTIPELLNYTLFRSFVEFRGNNVSKITVQHIEQLMDQGKENPIVNEFIILINEDLSSQLKELDFYHRKLLLSNLINCLYPFEHNFEEGSVSLL